MFDSIENPIKGMFGKVAPGKCRLTMNGNIAVKCSNGYKTYNVKKGTLTNVTNFCFDMGEEMFFVLPTNKVNIGDIILVQGLPKCVIGVDKKSISVIDYESSEERKIIPERHIFMGSTYYYGKIVSMFGNLTKGSKGTGNLMKMYMMSKLMGGNNGGGLGQMMAMSMFMGGKMENPFEGMFDFSLDNAIDDEEGDEKEESED